MNDEDLQRYLGREVRIELETGDTVTGELVGQEAVLIARTPYAVKWLVKNQTLGTFEPRYRAIMHASHVRSVTILDASPSAAELSNGQQLRAAEPVGRPNADGTAPASE